MKSLAALLLAVLVPIQDPPGAPPPSFALFSDGATEGTQDPPKDPPKQSPSPTASAKPADDLVDNPDFAGWAKCKPGAWIKFKVTEPKMPAGEYKLTLKEFKKDGSAQIEQLVTFSSTDAKQTTMVPLNIPAKLKKGENKEGHKMTKGKDGTETVVCGTKKIRCTWIEYKIEYKGGGADAYRSEKVWTSKDVIGGIAKFEKKEAASGDTTTWEAVEWKATGPKPD